MSIKKQLAGIALSLGLLFGGYTGAGNMVAPEAVVVNAVDEDLLQDTITFTEELYEASVSDGARYEDVNGVLHPAEDFWEKTEDGYYKFKDMSKLKTNEANRLVAGVVRAQSEFYEKEAENENGISTEIATRWWKEMQSVNGVGAQYVQQLTSDLKVDLQAGNAFFKPINGIIGVVLGIGSVAIFSFIALSLLLDIFYITIPFFRMMMDNSGQKNHGSHGGTSGMGGGGHGPAYISNQAKMAVKEEEGGKNALVFYLKKSILKLVVLVLCMMFLISGKIYPLIGWLMNIVSQMFGFSSI